MRVLVIVFSLLLLGGCTSSVPKEIVELSYQMEKDLVQLETGYISLVKQHISLLKQQREDYLQNEWVPLFIESWIKDGELIAMSDGSKVYDEQLDQFIVVTDINRQTQLNGIVEWANLAVEEIDLKRQSLIKPLEESETQLIEDINRSFSALLLGNQTVSAHLNSIREVQEVQNELLSKSEWGGLRNNLNQKLSDLSQEAQTGLKEIRKLDKKANKQLEKLK